MIADAAPDCLECNLNTKSQISFILGLIEGKATAAEEIPQLALHEPIERRKSTKVHDKRLSLPLSVRKKSRAVNKLS